jgi:hypothetical protein
MNLVSDIRNLFHNSLSYAYMFVIFSQITRILCLASDEADESGEKNIDAKLHFRWDAYAPSF